MKPKSEPKQGLLITKCIISTCSFNKICRSCKISKSPHQRGAAGCENGTSWVEKIPESLESLKANTFSSKSIATAICNKHNDLVVNKLNSLTKEFELLLLDKNFDFSLMEKAVRRLASELEAFQDALSLFQIYLLYLADIIAVYLLEKAPNEALLELSLDCLRLLTLDNNTNSQMEANKVLEVLENLIEYLSLVETPKCSAALLSVLRNLAVGENGASKARIRLLEKGFSYALKRLASVADHCLGFFTSLCFSEKGKELILKRESLMKTLFFLKENFKKFELKTQEKVVEFVAVGLSDEFESIMAREGAEFGELFFALVERITDHVAIFSEKTQYYVTNLQDKCRKLRK